MAQTGPAKRVTEMEVVTDLTNAWVPVAFVGIDRNFRTAASNLLSGAEPYSFRYWVAGQPDANELLLKFQAEEALIIAASLAGFAAEANTAATAEAVFTVSRSATQGGALTTLGTLTFAAAGTEATLAGAGGSIAAGEWVTIRAPTSQDATLADIAILFYATRP